MTHAREMLDTHPGTALMDADALIECIEACFDCTQTCTSCAEACLGEGMVEHMRRCVTMCLNCSDVCATTGRVVTRQTESEPAMVRAALQACAEACRLCGEECERHATEMDMEHCRVCADACRHCEEACNRALSALALRHQLSRFGLSIRGVKARWHVRRGTAATGIVARARATQERMAVLDER